MLVDKNWANINVENHDWPKSGRRTLELSPSKKTPGRRGYDLAWWRPSSRRQKPQLVSSVPKRWRSWHTRRGERRCRTAGRLGTCGKPFLHRRRQNYTLNQGSPFSCYLSNSSEKQKAKAWLHTQLQDVRVTKMVVRASEKVKLTAGSQVSPECSHTVWLTTL